MIGRPERTEAEPYYFRYIDQVPGDDVLGVLTSQLEETPAFLSGVSEEKSLHRYGPDKWTMRQVLNHVNDCVRLFAARAFWFARGFDIRFRASTRSSAPPPPEPTMSRGPGTSRSSGRSGAPRSPSSATSRRRPGRETGSRAATSSRCARWPGSPPAIRPTTSASCRPVPLAFGAHSCESPQLLHT